ncbi:MAG: amidase family protein, partial [Paralcaligenes sp.]
MSLVGDPRYWSVAHTSAEIAAGRLSSVELVEYYLERIDSLNGRLHAYTEVYVADARLAAQAADKAVRSGHSVGPLHGIPIAVKDVADIAGRITTGGSLVWKNRHASVTATLVQRLLSQGMILLGKTHTVEFTCGGWGTNTRMGTPWNPWDMNRALTPGGSSSGSGVAV